MALKPLVIIVVLIASLGFVSNPSLAITQTDTAESLADDSPHRQSEITTLQSNNRSFNVSEANARNTTVGGFTRVTAQIMNPNPKDVTQEITVRTGHGGEVLARKTVSISANESQTVEFLIFMSEELINRYAEAGELNINGWNFFTIQTRNHGSSAWYYLSNNST